MTEAQKYQKKKNLLIISFLVLLVVLVAFICYVFIYAKQNPPETFLDPSEIEIVQINTADYVLETVNNSLVINESNDFKVINEDKEYKLKLTEEGVVKIIVSDVEEDIEILLNEENINHDIKMIYQTANISLLLTTEGKLYKLFNVLVEDGKLKVGQILSDMTITDVVSLGLKTDRVFVKNSEDQIINTETLKEYNGIVDTLITDFGEIYIYENDSFGTEEGKVFINQNNQELKINIAFGNKIISAENIIYEVNVDKTLSTSVLGTLRRIAYSKNDEEQNYTVKILTTTGSYDFTPNYYYAK